MKTRKLIIACIWIAVATIVWSCNETAPVTPNLDLQENTFSANILQNSGSAMSRIKGIGFGGPIGAIYGNLTSNTGRNAGSPLALKRGALKGRSKSDSTEHVPDCLVETWEDDGAGNYTYTLDFGDGCEYYGEFLKGKLVETGSYSESTFTSTATYTNFGGDDWSIDGTYHYAGTWDESVKTDESNPDDSVWLYSARYEFEIDLVETYTEIEDDDEVTDQVTETEISVAYQASGVESMDQDSYTVESRTESAQVSTGEEFDSQVDVPLFMDYSCKDDVWLFVSGIESGSYTDGVESGTYSIDYGDGTCDTIILLTENGVTEEIDLGDEWDEWEEECESNDHD